MVDTLNDILLEAGGEQITPVETDPVETDPVENDPVENPPAEPEGAPTEPVEKEPVAKEPEKKSNPMKEVRDRLNTTQKDKERIEKTIQRFTDGDYKFRIRDFRTEDGKIDYEALAKAMDDEDLKVKAESKGISPEVQAEIDRIEREKLELQRERLRVDMDRAIANMQTSMGLKGDDINNFFKDSMALKKNPYQWLAQGGTLSDLYYLVYRDTLMKAEIDKAVEAAKAKWEASNSKKPPVTNPATPKTSSSGNTVSLNELLNAAFK